MKRIIIKKREKKWKEKNYKEKREESYLKIRKGLKMKRNELKMTTSSGYGS